MRRVSASDRAGGDEETARSEVPTEGRPRIYRECPGKGICEHGRVRTSARCGALDLRAWEGAKPVQSAGARASASTGGAKPVQGVGASSLRARRRRRECKECGGSSFGHGRHRKICRSAGLSNLRATEGAKQVQGVRGSSICEHGRRKYRCKSAVRSRGVRSGDPPPFRLKPEAEGGARDEPSDTSDPGHPGQVAPAASEPTETPNLGSSSRDASRHLASSFTHTISIARRHERKSCFHTRVPVLARQATRAFAVKAGGFPFSSSASNSSSSSVILLSSTKNALATSPSLVPRRDAPRLALPPLRRVCVPPPVLAEPPLAAVRAHLHEQLPVDALH